MVWGAVGRKNTETVLTLTVLPILNTATALTNLPTDQCCHSPCSGTDLVLLSGATATAAAALPLISGETAVAAAFSWASAFACFSA